MYLVVVVKLTSPSKFTTICLTVNVLAIGQLNSTEYESPAEAGSGAGAIGVTVTIAVVGYDVGLLKLTCPPPAATDCVRTNAPSYVTLIFTLFELFDTSKTTLPIIVVKSIVAI